MDNIDKLTLQMLVDVVRHLKEKQRPQIHGGYWFLPTLAYLCSVN